jgi:ABC-type bacteriocin/lantibiotic exporter with double-glycine peptidase domain
MLGLTGQMFNTIQNLRDDEIALSKKFRSVQSYNVTLYNLPDIVAKLLLFGAYAIVTQINWIDSLSISQAISSLALIYLVLKPRTNILIAIPQGWSAPGCFQRIQTFLSDTPQQGQALISDTENTVFGEDHHGKIGRELHLVRSEAERGCIILDNASFGWSESTQNPVSAAAVRIDSSEQRLTIVISKVGRGKSTLLKEILRETPYHIGHLGMLSYRVAYYDQTPWIIIGSIRPNIVAESKYDDLWYKSVLKACALDIDIDRLLRGDLTVVGSKGVNSVGARGNE